MAQTWDANPIDDIGKIASDLGGFFTGPPGDPGRIRQAAQRVEHLAGEYGQHAAAINDAVRVVPGMGWRRCVGVSRHVACG